MRRVPELSLKHYTQGDESERKQFHQDLFEGMKDYGFIILVDHDISQELIDRAYDKVQRFFHLSSDVKMKYAGTLGGQRGYTAFGTEHAKDNPFPDLKEFWHVGPELPDSSPFFHLYPANIWPDEIQGFRETMLELYSKLRMSAISILESLGESLDTPKGFFQDMVQEGNSILRPIYYPPLGHEVPAGSVRAAAHEDINLITILMGATASGLELLDRDGSWLPVKTKEGQLVVDTGDMMARLTNDVLPATTHRVINPETSSESRFSMPFFVHPHPEVELSCLPSCVGEGPKYPAINSHDFLVKRLKEIGLMETNEQERP